MRPAAGGTVRCRCWWRVQLEAQCERVTAGANAGAWCSARTGDAEGGGEASRRCRALSNLPFGLGVSRSRSGPSGRTRRVASRAYHCCKGSQRAYTSPDLVGARTDALPQSRTSLLAR